MPLLKENRMKSRNGELHFNIVAVFSKTALEAIAREIDNERN